ncbi:hypothetical protein [Candidatus Magnetominusculus xianensis]|uniref:Secreted protein n=1 Tax=Candidatus Magnetominusculus xianensis TaxID=1748249 RepID=A0ABR5SH08_9BACT|nr:hypothetical protein [Candidatus Magnetominusculus xianensis]KWT86918.1 hypothetical protein ASN18_1390 [Candidatus Magnetominusculus xianensis]MBF0403957.1 hypothetical protein [Nitrospirota bacterium]
MKKNVLTLMMIIVVGEIIFRIFYNIAILPIGKEIVEELSEFFSNNIDRYYEGAGHSNETGVRGFPADAFNVRKRINYDDALVIWLSFDFVTFNTTCREIEESTISFPLHYNCPRWWPTNLQKTLSPINRADYKFYSCGDKFYKPNYIYKEYYAIDNKSKHGYYWEIPNPNVRPERLMNNE